MCCPRSASVGSPSAKERGAPILPCRLKSSAGGTLGSSASGCARRSFCGGDMSMSKCCGPPAAAAGLDPLVESCSFGSLVSAPPQRSLVRGCFKHSPSSSSTTGPIVVVAAVVVVVAVPSIISSSESSSIYSATSRKSVVPI